MVHLDLVTGLVVASAICRRAVCSRLVLAAVSVLLVSAFYRAGVELLLHDKVRLMMMMVRRRAVLFHSILRQTLLRVAVARRSVRVVLATTILRRRFRAAKAISRVVSCYVIAVTSSIHLTAIITIIIMLVIVIRRVGRKNIIWFRVIIAC